MIVLILNWVRDAARGGGGSSPGSTPESGRSREIAGATGGGAFAAICIGSGRIAMHAAHSWTGWPGSCGLAGAGE